MGNLVTTGTEGDQIVLGVVSQPAPRLDVVHFEPGRVPTMLAAPPIPLQHLLAQPAVGLRVQPEALSL